jgi:hypothetical protein
VEEHGSHVLGRASSKAADLETIACSYWIAVRGVGRMGVTEADKLAALADLGELYRRERSAHLAQLLPETATACNTRQ